MNHSELNEWRKQWANYHVLLSMAQLGVFDLLSDDQPRSPEHLAKQLQCDPRAMDICGRILARAGLLNYQNGHYTLTESGRELPVNDLKWEWKRQQNYVDLVSVIRTGNPALNTSGGVVQEDMDDARQFLRMLHRGSATGVREALKILRQVIPAPDARILDLGGGHGRYAATFAAAFPDARVTLYDREIATQIAREISGEAFSTISGDFLRDTLANDDHPAYEVVFMSYIVSGIAIEEVGALFKRVRAVIPQGGVVIVQDMYVDADDHLSPASAIDFHLTLLLENERGRFRTVPEICELLREAGFTRTQHITANGHEFSYIVAW